MELRPAVAALAALAHQHRLTVFRALIRSGPNGMPAGDIADAVGVPPSTMSHHLAQLERAGLLHSRRVERRIFYAVELEATRRLLAFLIEDCCQGRPEICGYRSQVHQALCVDAASAQASCDDEPVQQRATEKGESGRDR